MGKFTNIVSAQITGNVGSMNFRRKNGEIVAAQRATTNSSKGDGASYAQRLHRIRIANIANMYRAIALIEQRGWENKGANQSDFNMFSKYNLASSPIFLTKQEAELGATICAPYAVSRGSLTPTIGRYTGEKVFNIGINIGSSDIDWDTMTIPDFSARLIENNKGWQYGDKLSICVCKQVTRTLSGVNIPQVEVTYLEITLDANSTQLLSDMGNWDALQLDADNDRNLQFLDGGDAAFAIHSREVAGKLLTSEQDMILYAPFSELVVKYSGDAQREAAMASYGYKDAVLLDPNSENSSTGGTLASIASVIASTSEGENIHISNGIEITGGQYLAVNGSNLSASNVKVQLFDDASNTWDDCTLDESSAAKMLFIIEDEGDYRVLVNGDVAYQFANVM